MLYLIVRTASWANPVFYFFLCVFCQVIKAAVGQVGAIAQGNLSAEDLSRAK